MVGKLENIYLLEYEIRFSSTTAFDCVEASLQRKHYLLWCVYLL